jgi:hypothetical protein
MAHSHNNKTVLDAFGDNGGQPTYNGNPIGSGETNTMTNVGS